MLAQNDQTAWFARLARLALLAVGACFIGALWQLWSRTETVSLATLAALPWALPTLLLVCAGALTALHLGSRTASLVLVGVVIGAVVVTVVGWVLNLPAPVGVALFGSLPEAQPTATWFPSAMGVRGATLLALVTVSIALLALKSGMPLGRLFVWAAGIVVTVGPALGFLVARFDSWWLDMGVTGTMDIVSQAPRAAIPTASITLTMLGTSCFGVALLATLRIQATAPPKSEWGARVRAVIVVLVLSFTLTLWHIVRSTEVRQLQADVNAAMQEVVRDVRTGLSNGSNSIRRLGAHFLSIGWQVSDATFLADADAYLRDDPAVVAVAIADSQGRLLHVARRTATTLPRSDAAASTNPNTDALTDTADSASIVAVHPSDYAQSEFAPLLQAGRIVAVTDAIRSAQPLRGVRLDADTAPPTHAPAATHMSLYPMFDSAGRSPGAVLIAFRLDTAIMQVLQTTLPEFHLRVTIDGERAYERVHADAATALTQQYRLVSRLQGASSAFEYRLEPSMRVVKRYLTWTPLLVLLFAWVSLGLLTYALYSERRAQLLLRDRERLLNESLDVICTLDAVGRYTTINDASQRLLGYAPSELLGRRFSEIVHPDDLGGLSKIWDKAQRGIRPPVLPVRFLHKNGRTVYLQGNAHWSEAEQLFYCDMRDVTEQHSLELAREHAAGTFRIGVEQAGCVVYEYLPQTQRIQWVGAVQALTGYEPDELSAGGFDAWMAAIHPDDRAHVTQTLLRCVETQQPHTIDYRVRHKDGRYVPVLDRGQHVTEGDAHRMIGALIDLTAIRRQEQALRRSEERYRIIATQVGAVIVEREIPSNRLHVYGPAEQIFGYTKEQMESRPANPNDVMIHPDDRERVLATVRHAQASLTNYYVEYRRRHRGGHYIHVAARAAILAGADGRAERAVTAYTDITERKQAEERLQESEERFRSAAEQARQIVYEYVFDDNLQIAEVRVAGAVEQVLGYTPDTLRILQQADRYTLIHPDDIPRVRAAGGGSIHTSFQYHVEHRLQHLDGHYVHVENRGAVKRDATGKVVGLVGMLLDISARKVAEADRQQYTTQLRMLADIARRISTFLSLHELLNYLVRSMRELIGANAAAASITDPALPQPGQVVAVSYAEHYGLQRSEAKPFGSPELHALLLSNSSPVRLGRAQTADDPRWSQLTQNDDLRHPLNGWLGVALTSRDGANLGLLELTDKVDGDFSDGDAQILNQLAGVTSVAIENILLYATLEERVAARTRELEISNRELEAFSYSVSHDLRAPLRAIAGFSSILEHEYGSKLDAAARRYLQRIGSGVERMANLIDDLLSLARVSRLDIKRESIDLTALCRTIAKRQRERLADREIDVKIDARMRANADPRLVEVALENLVENAIKFTGTRVTGQIHIGRRLIDGRAAFFVQDNGVGFDPQYASNLFGVFQRLHSASEFPGTGVGLATVQRIVQRHHGRVWAESQIDQGAVFYFTFESEA